MVRVSYQGALMAVGAEAIFGDSVITSTLESALSWARESSMWPYVFGTACCAIEFMSVASSKYDISRFGAEVVRFSPRQADLLIVAGTISYKQAPILKKSTIKCANPNGSLVPEPVLVAEVLRQLHYPSRHRCNYSRRRLRRRMPAAPRSFFRRTFGNSKIPADERLLDDRAKRVFKGQPMMPKAFLERFESFDRHVRCVQTRCFFNTTSLTCTVSKRRLELLVDMTAIDYLHQPSALRRFAIVYLLRDRLFSSVITLKIDVDETLAVDSIASLFKSANWAEREIWDQYGIHFKSHPNLKRILNHKEFIGHPLRKDYPITQGQLCHKSDDLMDEMTPRLKRKGIESHDALMFLCWGRTSGKPRDDSHL